MTDRRRAQGPSAQEDNPYAPPPEDRPDQPWQPRRPPQGQGGAYRANGEGGDNGEQGSEEDEGEHSARAKWGSQWSSRQPRRESGGFGSNKPQGGNGRGTEGDNGGMRWDPKDPAQRHARYAMISGMWSVFFALFNLPPVALLLGALALHWGISSLRGAPGVQARTEGETSRSAQEQDGRPRSEASATSPSGGPGQPPGSPYGTKRRPQLTAAVVGLVVGSLGLLFVLSSFTVRLVYKDYYDCVDSALTSPARQSCEQHLPEQLRPVLGERD